MTGSEPVVPDEGRPPSRQVPEPPRDGMPWYPARPIARSGKPMLRPLAALALFAAAILTLIGSFLDLFTGRVVVQGEVRFGMMITAWDLRSESGGLPGTTSGGVPANGAPLVFAAALLLVAAVLGVLAAAAPGAAGIVRASGMLAAVATAFLLGAVWTVGMEVMSWVDSFRPTGSAPSDGGVSSDVNAGIGFWLLLGGAVVAIAATVLGWLSGQVSRPLPVREEPETPRYGIPVVVRLPDEPAEPAD